MSNAAERQRRHRARQRRGLRVVTIEVDEISVSEALVQTGFLSPLRADDPDAIREAIEKHLAALVVFDLEGERHA
jgi:hypothetical protein